MNALLHTSGTRPARRAMFLALLGLLLGLLLPGTARASHLRAGDIQAISDTTATANPLRIFFRMTIYRDRSSTQVLQPQEATTIFFGDGTSATGTTGPSSPIIRTVDTNLSTADTEVLIFRFEHVYPAAFAYTVSFVGENRNDGVLNMTLSRDQSFYIETRITIDPAIRRNRSPRLLAPAYDKASVGQVYLHSPAAFDADGDSLSYEIIDCRQVPGGVPGVTGGRPNAVRCTNYVLPTGVGPAGLQVPYNGLPTPRVGDPSSFQQDIRTGLIVWNSPGRTGLYNIAFRVREFRRTPFGYRELGFVVRDMQIIVGNSPNLRPLLTIPPDICVVAGTTVTGTVTAIDQTSPNSPASAMALFAFGGMIPPATFTQTASGPPQARGTFRWNTECANVAKDPYQVLFKVQDQVNALPGDPPALVDQAIWRITVVGPPPQNLVAVPRTGANGNQVLLTWDRYVCANASNIYIFRKEDPSGFRPGPCETGIPASAGYVRIGSVTAATQSFVDDNGGAAVGLARGKTYCYRIYADFPLPAGGASIASAEACAAFPGRAARLKNVDVERTDAANGQVAVRWTTARGSAGLPLNGPGGYRLFRAPGLNPTPAAFQLIRTFNSIADDSVLIDTGLNTVAFNYTYRLEMFYAASPQPGAPSVTEVAAPASSVRLAVVPNGLARTNALTWTYQVPWDNAPVPVAVFRRLSTSPAFTRLPATPATGPTGGTYLDNDPALQQGLTYCYYVQTTGRYLTPGTTTYLSALLNRSQELCAVLAEVPCQPVLTVLPPNCDSLAAIPNFPAPNQTYTNRLRWTAGTEPTGCTANVAYYRIFYRATLAGAFRLIDSTATGNIRFYNHRNVPEAGGCYAVQGVSGGAGSRVTSLRSNEVCQTECQIFELPNVFTPDGDELNPVFKPKTYSAVKSVKFRAYSRWGVKVFENETAAAPFINWDGTGRNGEQGSPAPVSGGVYLYVAEVEFADATKRTYKGWVEIIKR